MNTRTRLALGILAASLIAASPRALFPQTTAPDDRVTALIKQLGDLGPNATGEKYELVRKTKDELKRIGAPAVGPLVDLVITSGGSSTHARDTLIEMGPSIVPLIQKKWDDTPGTLAQFYILPILEKLDPAVPLAYMRQWLATKDPENRGQAMHYLAQHHDDASKPAILAALNHEDMRVRWSAVRALGLYGGDDVIAAFLPLLQKDSWAAKGMPWPAYPDSMPYYAQDGRHVIAGTLWWSLHAKIAAPELLRILREEGEGKGYMGDVLIPALADLNYQPAVPELRAIRAEAARAATRPAESRPFTPWVEPHDIARDARLAAFALLQLGDRSVVPALLKEYRDHLAPDKPNKMDNVDFRREIVKKLSPFAIYDEIPLIVQFLDDPDATIQYEATRALGRLTGSGERDLPYAWRDWWKSHAKDFPPPK